MDRVVGSAPSVSPPLLLLIAAPRHHGTNHNTCHRLLSFPTNFTQGSRATAALAQWAALVCRCCGDDQPLEVKVTAAMALVSCADGVLTNPQLPLGASRCSAAVNRRATERSRWCVCVGQVCLAQRHCGGVCSRCCRMKTRTSELQPLTSCLCRRLLLVTEQSAPLVSSNRDTVLWCCWWSCSASDIASHHASNSHDASECLPSQSERAEAQHVT